MQPGSVPHSDSAVPALPRVVREYKRYYYLLLIVSGLLLLSIIAYVWLWKEETGNAYAPLTNNARLSGVMAADDSSGQLIATVARNDVDSLVSILVSEDGGEHFEEWGVWKITAEEKRSIHKIYIAPDRRSIVAIDDQNIYIKSEKRDSFTVVGTAADFFQPLAGAVFSKISDSVFAYAGNHIYALDYKQYDSIRAGSLEGLSNIKSLTIAEGSNHFAGIAISEVSNTQVWGAFMNYRMDNARNYPVNGAYPIVISSGQGPLDKRGDQTPPDTLFKK